MKSTVEHPLFGEIVISRRRGVKRISLSVRPPSEVRITMPQGVAIRHALNFVEQKSIWIEKAIKKLEGRSVSNIFSMPFSTRNHNLRLKPADVDNISWKIIAKEIVVSYPMELLYDTPQVQQAIAMAIEEAWRIEAKEILPERVRTIAQRLNLPYGSVTIRKSKTRWGSCSYRNDISLSLYLMKLDDELVDYIIIHELCHTKVKNHSPQFHEMLNQLTNGRHKELDRKVKQIRIRG